MSQHTKTDLGEPWRVLSAGIADVIEPELPEITEEILATIARQVPEYARPFEGAFGAAVRTGTSEALTRFVALVRDPDAGRSRGREVYIGLGRAELQAGRTLDSLQSAYRIGARVAWRRLAAAGRAAGLDPEALSLLAESIFAYIEELSAASVEGYAEAASQLAGEQQHRRRELATLLVGDPPADGAEVRASARAAGWPLPQTAAALACAEADLPEISSRLPGDVVVSAVEGFGCAIVPDPQGPSRAEELERAVGGRSAALGIAAQMPDLAASWASARACLRAVRRGAIDDDGLVRADRQLAALVLIEAEDVVERIAERRLAPLAGLTERARERMEVTALAYLRERGNAAAMARALHVHPQTARYRLARLRELLGDDLDDPDARFELELALRAQRSNGNR